MSYTEQLCGTRHPLPKEDGSAEDGVGRHPERASQSEGLAHWPGLL